MRVYAVAPIQIRMRASREFAMNPEDETTVRRGAKTQVVISHCAGPTIGPSIGR